MHVTLVAGALGRALSAAGLFERALSPYRRALAVSAGNKPLLEEIFAVLHTATECVNDLRVIFAPFLPFSSQRLHEMLGHEGLLAAQPESGFLHTELARMQMRRGDLLAALQSCQEALHLSPNYQPAYLVLGQIHANLQHQEEAQTAFRKAIELEPLQEEGYVYLGVLQMATGKQAFPGAEEV